MKYLFVFMIAALTVFPYEGYTESIDIVFAVGDNSTLLQLVGDSSWVAVPIDSIPGCGDLLSVWGSSDNDVYVTGCYDELLHFDGTQWQMISMPNPSVWLTAVSGTGSSNIYAVGYVPGPTHNGLSYHFDGLSWNEIQGGGNIQDVWVDAAGGFYAISEYYDYWDKYWYQRVVSYKNGTWNVESLLIGRYTYYFEDEYYLISGRGQDRPIVTGYWELDLYDENFNHTVGTGGAIHVKENSTWDVIRENEPCGQYPACPLWSTVWHGICNISEYEIWFAGENSKVMQWTPFGYAEYNLSLPTTFRAIWASSRRNVYIVGDYGYIVHFNGVLWRVMQTPTTENLHDIWGFQEELSAIPLQYFTTSVEESRITIRWSLSELDENARFRVTRTSVHESTPPTVNNNPTIERDGLSFTYVDLNVDPGTAYEYLIEYSIEDRWHELFKTGIVSIPNVSLDLLTNYPNPFNPSTMITYSVPEHSQVTLRIFDVSGKLVRTIVDEKHVPGRYTNCWNGLNDQGHRVASGTYFCRLTVGKTAVSKKILLTR